MSPRIDIITLGVSDLGPARQFYEHGLGCAPADERADGVTFRLGADASLLSLRRWDALAGAAGVSGAGSGFRGFMLSYIVESAAHVDDVLARVVRSGGEISRPPRNALWATARTSPTRAATSGRSRRPSAGR